MNSVGEWFQSLWLLVSLGSILGISFILESHFYKLQIFVNYINTVGLMCYLSKILVNAQLDSLTCNKIYAETRPVPGRLTDILFAQKRHLSHALQYVGTPIEL